MLENRLSVLQPECNVQIFFLLSYELFGLDRTEVQQAGTSHSQSPVIVRFQSIAYRLTRAPRPQPREEQQSALSSNQRRPSVATVGHCRRSRARATHSGSEVLFACACARVDRAIAHALSAARGRISVMFQNSTSLSSVDRCRLFIL